METRSKTEFERESIGHQLGFEGVESVVGKVEAYCDCERQRIELTNQAEIVSRQAEIALLADREKELRELRRHASPPGEARMRRIKALYCLTVAALLTIAAFIFSVVAFEPYRLGWKGYVYSVGIAIVTPFCVYYLLEKWDSERLIKALITVSCIASLTSLVLLAVIRGDLFLKQMDAVGPALILESDNQMPAPPEDTFYKDTVPILRLVMALLALAMELGAGLALHDAERHAANSGNDYERLWRELQAVHAQMVARVYEITALRNEPAVFVNRFWRDFYRAMIGHTIRNALTKLLLLLLLTPLICHAQASSAERLNLVIALDLSTSVDSKGRDKTTEFQKNVAAVGRLLGTIPPASKVTVLGITENSFSQPYIILLARVPGGDQGYFGDRITAARIALVRAWQHRAANLEPNSPGTDILGALVVAAQLFEQTPNAERRVLILFSDMRQFTRDLKLENSADIPLDRALEKIERKKLLAQLNGIEVYVLGVDAAGKEPAAWDSVRQFWVAYLGRAGARLKNYSMLRIAPEFEQRDSQTPR